ncbi:MAG: alpha/beta fold hydrolase [Propionibacteriaceae bacterium]|nr:alpha/beta fold hydrolase [Propionibacteriaceae bacterium]
MTVSIDVSWQLDDITMEGTITRPDGAGPFPGVVLVAGSGPTDRDWCSPLLPGTNGAGKQFAEALADAGIASMRYDKRASGPNVMANLPKLIGHISMQSHLEELAAAVQAFVAQGFVVASKIIGLGNSEGTLHVLHYAASNQATPFAGIVLAAPPGRPVRDLVLMQFGSQAALIPDGDALMEKVREACARYDSGQPMDPDPSLPESARMTLLSFETPVNQPLARELWAESACDTLPKITIPTLVLIGGKDVQVDRQADGDPLQQCAAGMANVTFAFPPDANHVFKHETRSVAEVLAAGTGYNDSDTPLDPDSLATILDWINAVVLP